MMSTVPTGDLAGLTLVVLLLGVKHGFDADHLAAIDGLTRRNAQARPRLARRAGALFSLGHGVVVVSVALVASTAAAAWHPPAWLDAFGAWTSITVLCSLAAVNIKAALQTGPDGHVALVGWRAGLWRRVLDVGHPVSVMAVGALFALSFDTFGQAALFAVAAQRVGGQGTVALLAGVFVLGMLMADGANGVWISRLIRRSDESARIASRVMALAVSGVGLLTAGFSIALQTSDGAQAWAVGNELWFGTAVTAIVAVSYLIGRRLARSSPRTAQPI